MASSLSFLGRIYFTCCAITVLELEINFNILKFIFHSKGMLTYIEVRKCSLWDLDIIACVISSILGHQVR